MIICTKNVSVRVSEWPCDHFSVWHSSGVCSLKVRRDPAVLQAVGATQLALDRLERQVVRGVQMLPHGHLVRRVVIA